RRSWMIPATTATQSINQLVGEGGARNSVPRGKLAKLFAHCMAAPAANPQPAIFPIPERVNRLRAMIISGHAGNEAPRPRKRSRAMIGMLRRNGKKGALWKQRAPIFGPKD
ncbi:hypothetical protein, partial [Erythrobacter sp. MTPC3]|uniref:hypothetical protein n=1 Tax=Erythrobacter sp. MTPC3 TaxID=3056564 RepID=UPI0036F1CF5C